MIFSGARVHGSQDAIWSLIYDFFVEWRASLERVAEDCYRKQKQCAVADASQGLSARLPFSKLHDTEILFDTPEWWACMIHEKRRNYDLARKRLIEVGNKPSNISTLPIFQEPQKHDGLVDEPDPYGVRSESDDESSDDEKREKMLGEIVKCLRRQRARQDQYELMERRHRSQQCLVVSCQLEQG